LISQEKKAFFMDGFFAKERRIRICSYFKPHGDDQNGFFGGEEKWN
jgi:hypothetical protein